MKTSILKNKNYEIEFLRAVSVLFVVFFHFNLFNFRWWLCWSRYIFCN